MINRIIEVNKSENDVYTINYISLKPSGVAHQLLFVAILFGSKISKIFSFIFLCLDVTAAVK